MYKQLLILDCLFYCDSQRRQEVIWRFGAPLRKGTCHLTISIVDTGISLAQVQVQLFCASILSRINILNNHSIIFETEICRFSSDCIIQLHYHQKKLAYAVKAYNLLLDLICRCRYAFWKHWTLDLQSSSGYPWATFILSYLFLHIQFNIS